MSRFTKTEIKNIEKFLGMSSGYVLDFSDRTLLTVGAATTLCVFLFETHEDTKE